MLQIIHKKRLINETYFNMNTFRAVSSSVCIAPADLRLAALSQSRSGLCSREAASPLGHTTQDQDESGTRTQICRHMRESSLKHGTNSS